MTLAQYDHAIREMEAVRDGATHENAQEAYDRATEMRDEAQQDWLDLELGQADVRVTGEEGDPCRIGHYSVTHVSLAQPLWVGPRGPQSKGQCREALDADLKLPQRSMNSSPELTRPGSSGRLSIHCRGVPH